MNRQPSPGYQRGDRIVLEHTTDPYTRLAPGAEGTVTGYDPKLQQLRVAWDDGSTLAMLLADGDRVRPATPPATARPQHMTRTLRNTCPPGALRLIVPGPLLVEHQGHGR